MSNQPTQVFSRFGTPPSAYPYVKTGGGSGGGDPSVDPNGSFLQTLMGMGGAGAAGGAGAGQMDILGLLSGLFSGMGTKPVNNTAQPGNYSSTGGMWA